MIERTIDVPTKDGKTTTFIVHPERGGPHPVIMFYMDAPAIREELRDMARRFASGGYYVMLPNLYYRSGVMEIGPLSRDPNDPGRKRMFELMESLTIPKIMDDTRGLLRFVDEDDAARKTKMGAVGYCMSGQYAINAAAQFPDRFAAAASVYGVRLVTEAADSPHLMAERIKGESYFACAEIDSWAPKEMVDALRKAVVGLKTEVEWYPGAEHGFAFPQRPAYNKDAAERHWERLNALWRRNLG
ncbi:MAG TPA: dienelactone hydrolase family protein [Rhizomicrobium sp.]|nr:dienelactone hydrolase family protein [Rhizomicrobium sp.]